MEIPIKATIKLYVSKEYPPFTIVEPVTKNTSETEFLLNGSVEFVSFWDNPIQYLRNQLHNRYGKGELPVKYFILVEFSAYTDECEHITCTYKIYDSTSKKHLLLFKDSYSAVALLGINNDRLHWLIRRNLENHLYGMFGIIQEIIVQEKISFDNRDIFP